MFNKIVYSVLILMVALSLMAFAQEDTTYVAGQVIIKVEAPFSSIGAEGGIVVTEQSWFNSLAQEYDISELRQVFNSSQFRFRRYYLAVFSEEYTVDEVMGAFEAEADVLYAVPNAIGEFFADPTDEFYNLQWGLQKIKADSAWNIESGNSSVILGILDSGTDLGDQLGSSPHPDLLNNLWNDNGMYGYNARQPGEFPHDGFGHGTHVAGIAGAVMNNTEGVASVAGGGFGGDDGVQIMTVKTISDDGDLQLAWAAEAVRWAADPDDDPNTLDGAHIINMSWGFQHTPPILLEPLEVQIKYADSLGILLIAAAGNRSWNLADPFNPGQRVHPAMYEEVMAVASTDSNDFRSSFSNYGAPIEVCAPGGSGVSYQNPNDIFSTMPVDTGFFYNKPPNNIPEEYAYLAGTSMSSPMVAGLAALLKSYDPSLTAQEIRTHIKATADIIPDQVRDKFAGKLGAGRINAYAALLSLSNGIAHPNLVYWGRVIEDAGGDSLLNAGENVTLIVKLKNFWEDAQNVSAFITSPDSILTSDIIFAQNPLTIAHGETGSAAFQFTLKNDILPGEYGFILHFESGNYVQLYAFYLDVYTKISAGFPVHLNTPVASEPKIVDLDGNGNREMVILGRSGTVHIVHGNGQIDPPIYSNAGDLLSAPAIGDLDGDGDLEIIFTSQNGKVYAIHHDGTNMDNFPVDLQNEFTASPVLADVDGDHDLEIIVAGGSSGTNNVFVLESDGTIRWQASTGGKVELSPAAGDYNSDGNADIFCVTGVTTLTNYSKVIIFNGLNGQILNQSSPMGEEFPSASPSVALIDENDLYLDVIFSAPHPGTSWSRSFLINGMDLGIIKTIETHRQFATPITDFDVNNNGLEFLSSFEVPDIEEIKYKIFLYDKNGDEIDGTEVSTTSDQLLICDLNDDGLQDVVSYSNYLIEAFDNQLNFWNELFVRSTTIQFKLAPVVSDFNNDGFIDITTVNHNGDIYVYDLNYPYQSNAHHWPEAQRDMFNSKRYDSPALSGPLPANTAIEWSGTVRISGDVTVPATSTLNIAPGTKIIFQHGDDEKAGESPTMPELRVYGTLNANGTESNPIEFFSYSRWYGIVADGNAQLTLNHCWIDKAQRGVYIKPGSENPIPITHSFNHCEISRGQYGIYSSYKKLDVSECRIHQQTFAGIYCAAGEANIQNSEISHNSSGVYLSESTFAISGNNIFDNGDYGIDVSNCAKGSIIANLLQDNSANAGQPEHPPLAAIRLFNSAAKIYGNHILYNQENGLLLLRESFPALQETNLLLGNGPSDGEEEPVLEKAEILIEDVSAPYMGGGHNDIVDERPHAGYLMIHTGEVHGLIDVTSNYWGGEGPVERLYPLQYYDYEPWDPLPNSGGGLPKIPVKDPASGSFAKTTEDSSAQLFTQALGAEDQQDYASAKTLYLQILSAYPDSMETLYSLPRLLACELALNGDFAALQNFYTAFGQNVGDTLRSKIAANLARRCQVRQELFNEAIVGYEAIVQQPPSLADSVYAVIDIGEIYLL